eukprot:scaffold12016_cov65-Attheya_sp.AAC.1
MFINKLTAAYQDLSDYKEDVAEGKKVRDFLDAIKTPALDTGKAQVIANPNTYSTLESVTNYLAHFVKSQSTMQQKIAGAGRGDGRRGRGRGRGPGGRDGRRRGRGPGRSAKPTVSARNFKDDEWEQFSPEEHIEVARLRDEKKRKRAAGGTSALRSAPDDADDDEGSADKAGTLMKSTPKKMGRKDERTSRHTEVGRGRARTRQLYQDLLVLKQRIIVT